MSSESEALGVLRGQFSLLDTELHDLSRAFLGLPRPLSLEKEDPSPSTEGERDLPGSFPSVLGMVGYMRSGKDVVASLLQEHYRGVERMAFSDPIISECNAFLADWGHRISEKNKDDYRAFLQNWSMARRSEEEDYWSRMLADKIERSLESKRLLVLTGVRLPADLRLINKHRGQLWRVIRGGSPKSMHPNEAWIDQIPCHANIYNQVEGDIAPLARQIEEILDKFK